MKQTNIQLPDGRLLSIEGGDFDPNFVSNLIAEKMAHNTPGTPPRLTKQSTAAAKQVTTAEEPLALPALNFDKQPQAAKVPPTSLTEESPLAVPRCI